MGWYGDSGAKAGIGWYGVSVDLGRPVPRAQPAGQALEPLGTGQALDHRRAALLLRHVGELVGQHLLTVGGHRQVALAPDEHVAADGERLGVERAGQLVGGATIVEADRAEVGPEDGLEAATDAPGSGRPCPAGCSMAFARPVSSGRADGDGRPATPAGRRHLPARPAWTPRRRPRAPTRRGGRRCAGAAPGTSGRRRSRAAAAPDAPAACRRGAALVGRAPCPGRAVGGARAGTWTQSSLTGPPVHASDNGGTHRHEHSDVRRRFPSPRRPLTRIDQADLTYLALAPAAAGAQDEETVTSRPEGCHAAAGERSGHRGRRSRGRLDARPAQGISWPRGLAVQLVLIAIAIILLRLL